VEAASAAIELHGGNGYCEDWGLTRQLRDAQCHPIWEGTEVICSLDVLRAIRRDESHGAVLSRIDDALAIARPGAPSFVGDAVDAVAGSRSRLAARIDELPRMDAEDAEARAGRLTWLLARTVTAALLLERSVGEPRKALVALRYVRRNVVPERAWGDRIAAEAAREMLAYAEMEEASAAKAAA
jgi:hypothetical protein